MRGLPFSVRESDICQFFRGMGYITGSVKLGRYHDGKLTGEACILFESPEHARNAQATLNKQYIGSRYVDLFVVTAEFHKFFGEQHR